MNDTMVDPVLEASAFVMRHGYGRIESIGTERWVTRTYTPQPQEGPQAFLARVKADLTPGCELTIDVKHGRFTVAHIRQLWEESA